MVTVQENVTLGAPLDAERLARDIAAHYVAELRGISSILTSSPAKARARFDRAVDIIRDVVRTIDGVGDPTAGHAPPLLLAEELTELRGVAVALVYALQRLFRIGLPTLLDSAPGDVVGVASALSARLAAESAAFVHLVANASRPAEVIDRERIGAILTRREVAVFEMLLQDAPIRRISAELEISPHTAKHHITSIGRKLAVSGRGEVMRRARELGVLVAAPVAAASAIANEAVAALGALL